MPPAAAKNGFEGVCFLSKKHTPSFPLFGAAKPPTALIILKQKKKALSATRKGFPTKKHEKILLTNLDVSS
ncbi:MAG: hypothetical protein ACEQR5_04565 [Moraxellaceae bacterium]